MSAADTIARGLAVRARADAGRRARVLMAAGPSGPIHGASGASFVTAHRVTLPPDTIRGGETLRLNLQLAKYAPLNAGHSWRLQIGGVTVAQNAVGATVVNLSAEQVIHIAHDRKSAFAFSRNALNLPSLNTAGGYARTGGSTIGNFNLGARQPSQMAMFVDYSPPPTVETIRVDFSQPVTVALEVVAQNGDVVEVLGLSLELLAAAADPVNFASPNATALWGDSLIEGAGASSVGGAPMDVAAQLRRLRPGWPIAGKGLGGQKAAAIIDRLMADPVAGRQWNAVLWTGANDFDSNIGNGPGWLTTIRAQIDRALAYRTNPNTIICNLYPNADWTAGDANYQAMRHVNAGLATAYGDRVCDLFTALATDQGKAPASRMADSVHLNNAGYGIVAQAIDAKITALGW